MNNNVRKITEGAMMTAIYAIVLFINRQTSGMIEFYFLFALPIPLVVYSARYGLKDSLLVCASVFLVSFMFALPQTWFYVITSMVVGVTYGSLVKKKTKNGILLSLTILVSVVFTVLTTIVFASFFGYNVAEELMLYEDILNQTLQSGVAKLPLDITKFVLVVFVAGTILTGVLEGALVHMISNLLLRRLKIEVYKIQPLSKWSVPKWTGYVAFTLFSLGSLSSYVTIINDKIKIILLVLMIASMLYLLLFGYIAALVIGMVVYKKNISLILMLLMFLLFSIMVPVLVGLGFLYVSFDLKEKLLIKRG